MAYNPYTWSDGAEGNTPITAARLNALEQGLGTASTNAEADIEVGDVPNLPAGKIDSGTFADDRIPTLAQSKITGLVAALSDIHDRLEALEDTP